MMRNAQHLFKFLLESGLNANSNGLRYKNRIFSISELIVVVDASAFFLDTLLANGAHLSIKKELIGSDGSVESKIHKRQTEKLFGVQAHETLPRRLLTTSSGDPLSLILDQFINERYKATSLIKEVLYFTQSAFLASPLVRAMPQTDIDALSLTEILLLIAIINNSSTVTSRLLQTDVGLLVLLSTAEEVELVTNAASLLEEKDYFSYLFFSTGDSEERESYFSSAKILTMAMQNRLESAEQQELSIENNTMAELQAIINQYTHTRPKLAHVGLVAMLYLTIIRETNCQLLTQKIAGLFHHLAEITSREPFKNQSQIHQSYRHNAEVFRETARIVEGRENDNVVGMRYRFHTPAAVETERREASVVNNAIN